MAGARRSPQGIHIYVCTTGAPKLPDPASEGLPIPDGFAPTPTLASSDMGAPPSWAGAGSLAVAEAIAHLQGIGPWRIDVHAEAEHVPRRGGGLVVRAVGGWQA